MGRQWLFKLDQNPEGRGLRCDSDGLFLGRDALLDRDESGNFAARLVAELQKVLRRHYGDDSNWESHSRSVELVAWALNKGDLARAMMTAVLMRLPEPGDPAGNTDADEALVKAGFNPDEPRDERGRWTTGGDGANELSRDPRTQLADAGVSDASNDAIAQAAARAAANAARRHQATGESQTKSWLAYYKKLWAAIITYFGTPQSTTHIVGDLHEKASEILAQHLAKMRGVKNIYFNRQLNTITEGEINSTLRPDVTVIMKDGTVYIYEVLSPDQTEGEMIDKYRGVQPIKSSNLRLSQVKSMSIEEIMALPDLTETEAEQLKEQAAIATELEEEELLMETGPP
ncbi:MAG TPA: hypothetical protein VGK90_14200 [Rhizomicrobium sp.]|jgi:hypothetical protein